MEEEAGSSTRRRGTRRVIDKKSEEGHSRLFNNYFSENPVYTDDQLRRRFRMRKHVFMRIVEALAEDDEYFRMRPDATRRRKFSPLQKCTSAIRMLTYGSSADSNDDYVRMAESTSLEYFDKFKRGMIKVFGNTYLRRPNSDDIEHLLRMGEAHGFPGMLGSIDCMHWEWKNCPVALKGQFYRSDNRVPTVMLEAVVAQYLWIWHAFFGILRSNNDINMLNQSNVFNDVLQGRAPKVHYIVNQHEYDLGYYLTDGIYPEKVLGRISKEHLEGFKLDLQSYDARLERDIEVCNVCVHHMHNMIVEDERDIYDGNLDYSYDHVGNDTPKVSNDPHPDFQEYLRNRFQLRDKSTHHHLQADLIEHIWENCQHETD